jgi:DNA transposition AAA+ family ATPase
MSKTNLDNLKEIIEQSGLTYEQIGKRIGRSKGTVSGIVMGKYSSNNLQMITDAIVEICTHKEAANDTPASNDFFTTTQSVQIDRLERVLESGAPFFETVLGESGTGKTTAMQAFSRNRDDVLYVKARENQSVSMLGRMLLKETGERKLKGNADELCTAFCETCSSTGISMIIIDEADLWVHGSDEAFSRKVELVREIYESGITVVLVGLPELKKRIAKLGGYAQNRITSGVVLKVTVEELEAYGVMKGMKHASTLAKNAANHGYFRMFAKVEQNMLLGYDEQMAISMLHTVKLIA